MLASGQIGPAEALRQLASSIVDAIESRPDVLGSKLVEVPDLTGTVFDPPPRTGKHERPATYRFVDDFAAMDHERSMKELVESFRMVEDILIWGHAPGYSNENVGQSFLDNYCHALLTGPDGPLRCDSPLGAFVLFGPDTCYQDHSHEPNEVYLALTDGGEWRVGREDWLQLSAGDTIFIPSNAVHAIRTNHDPLLTFSFWLEPGGMEEIRI